MIDYKETLIFPTLRYISDTRFHYRDGKVQDLPLYSLDWSYKDSKCKEKHDRWASTSWPDLNIPFAASLPEKYDSWIINLKFALPYHYRQEIIRNSRRAIDEWSIKRSFDTNVRETCLSPAIEHVWTAFYLLSDCVYDEITNYYQRGSNNDLVRYCLPYKFWSYQTGRGCRKYHSHINELENIEYKDDNMNVIVQQFLTELKKYEEKFDELYNVIHVDTVKHGN